MTIREKTLLAAGLILIILLAPSVYSLLMLKRISSLSASLAGPDAERSAEAARFEDLFAEVSRSARLMRVDPEFEEKLREGIGDLRTVLQRLGEESEPPVPRTCAKADEALARFGDLASSEEPAAIDLDSAEADVRRSFARIRWSVQRLADRRSAESERLAERAATLTMLATAVGLAIAVALWASLVWSLNRPLNDLIRGTERIARGQFDEKIPVRAADELGRLAGSFNRMADALNDLERMKAEFLAAASHGLRTPLACAKGHLAGMQAGRQGPLSEDSRRTADRIEAELDRVSRFVDQLLDLGRIRAGRLNLDIRGLPAAAFFTSVGRSFEAVAQEKDVGYEIVVDEGMPGRIQADPDRLGEALTNLLENAFKYTPRGGRVRLGVRGAGQRVRVEVADSGPGIPEGEEALIFERYYRGGGITVQGTGLGLAIARGIVEQHGGSIWAENGEPEGARFIFEVPVEQVAA